jgi:2-hydroxychromene-2-carboxylate isomerase
MTQEFKDQGGAATSDPSRFQRWLTSRIMSTLFTKERVARQRVVAEKRRQKEQRRHRVEYFHQVDDGYSQLAVSVLKQFASRYDVELRCHLVRAPAGKNVAEPELLSRLSRRDARLIAPGYGLSFPAHADALGQDRVDLATRILAAQLGTRFVDIAERVGCALWSDDAETLKLLARELGQCDSAEAQAIVEQGTARRRDLKHYSGAMFYYEGEWYWGVDRLHHLEARLRELGLDKEPAASPVAPRPEINLNGAHDNSHLTLEIFPSLRSPYTAIVFDRAVALAHEAGVALNVRPVLPMVMRGVPATREKGMYIFMDAAREARTYGVDYGKFYDPIGEPARRCYSLYPWAKEQGKDIELISSFLRHAFALGVNTNKDAALRRVVEGAGLSWQEAQQHLDSDGWQQILEANRQQMYASGLWGVPSFRLLNAEGDELLAVWGQDRLWLVAREIAKSVV